MTTVALLGLLLALVGNLWIIVSAFKESVLWGLGCLFVPLVALIFCLMYIRDLWKPLVLAVVGWLLFFANGGLGAS